jgi:hypothetical protein
MSATRKNTVKFLIPYCKTITMQYSFPDRVLVWNSLLPPDVSAAQSLQSFQI